MTTYLSILKRWGDNLPFGKRGASLLDSCTKRHLKRLREARDHGYEYRHDEYDAKHHGKH